MKSYKELLEALGARIQPGKSLDRVYSTNFKLIQIPGKPGETSEPTITQDGTVIPPGYRKFRAGAVVFSKAGSSPPRAPDFRSSDNEDSNRARDIIQKHKQDIKKLYNNTEMDGEMIEEGKGKSSEAPYILTLKKVTTRTYPGNVQVTLYYNDRLKKYFSVPMNDDTSIGISEEVLVGKFLEVFKELSEKNQEKLLKNLEENYQGLKKFILEL
jgi:hypothetical protein